MGTAAKINKLSLLIKRESFMFGQPSFDVFYLELLIQVSANLQGLVSWLFDPFKRLTLLDDLFHLGFDGSKVIFGKGISPANSCNASTALPFSTRKTWKNT